MRPVLILSVMALLVGCSSTPQASEGVTYLFAQNSDAITIDDGSMTLVGLAPTTLYFSDRPDRIVGHMTNDSFLDVWYAGDDDSFAVNPPNATLSIFSDEAINDLVVVLSNPRLVGADLTYDIAILDGVPPGSGGPSSLFIDVIVDHVGGSLDRPLHEGRAVGHTGGQMVHSLHSHPAYGRSANTMDARPNDQPGRGQPGGTMDAIPRDHTGGELSRPPIDNPG